MERARIIVKGEVQGVGYRGEVKKIARKLDIVGKVRNVKPYDVEIIAEGEKKNLEGFTEQIRIKESPIEVEDIQTEFEPATGEFDYFEIERGDLGEELGERLDIARGVMNDMVGKQDQTIQEVKTVGVKVDNMAETTDNNFTTLRSDYGKISKTMEKILESMDNTSKKTEKVLEALVQQQGNFTDAINGQTKAILALAEKKS
ncbi:MAG: acylphosphatase [Candidatus Altiarchaeales archaeon]|nr:acylphosphatase [Candidatus Altiarchaeota archaeon]MBU4342152.1 acylphosphatase [Candidatus Altiarchaeota archaeon]MBU4437575.1 acylphosphatase [Candidatus Altiarchaeota archaeon]MCG2782125.1 acylphosphatase [Candidatus Altiarchaeales archaeon]